MSVVIPHHQGLDRTPRYDEAVLEDRMFGIWRPACQTTLTFILSYPEPTHEFARPRGDDEVLSTLPQAVEVGPPLRRAGEGWFWAGMVAALGLAFVALLGMAP